ncbi:hypothetical protein BGX24_002313 [Mortierella sp. AD032]|nr:hypothetical protein BGX24_002313 [Mortierella sp. AD032]
MVCKHLALAAIGFPDTNFRPQGYMELRADSLSVGPEEDLLQYDEPAPTVLTDAQTIDSVVDSIKNYISIIDRDKAQNMAQSYAKKVSGHQVKPFTKQFSRKLIELHLFKGSDYY